MIFKKKLKRNTLKFKQFVISKTSKNENLKKQKANKPIKMSLGEFQKYYDDNGHKSSPGNFQRLV